MAIKSIHITTCVRARNVWINIESAEERECDWRVGCIDISGCGWMWMPFDTCCWTKTIKIVDLPNKSPAWFFTIVENCYHVFASREGWNAVQRRLKGASRLQFVGQSYFLFFCRQDKHFECGLCVWELCIWHRQKMPKSLSGDLALKLANIKLHKRESSKWPNKKCETDVHQYFTTMHNVGPLSHSSVCILPNQPQRRSFY